MTGTPERMVHPREAYRIERERKAAEREARNAAKSFPVYAGDWNWTRTEFTILEYDAIETAKLLKIRKKGSSFWHQRPASELNVRYHLTHKEALMASLKDAQEALDHAKQRVAVRAEQVIKLQALQNEMTS